MTDRRSRSGLGSPTLFAAFLASLVAVAAFMVVRGPSMVVDLFVYDLMVRSAGSASPSRQVVIVTIDDESVGRYGAWPWPRDLMARLIERLHALGAPVIAVDLLLPANDGQRRLEPDVAADTEVESIDPLDRSSVVLGYALTFASTRADDKPCALSAVSTALPEPGSTPHPADRLFQASGSSCPGWSGHAAAASGFLNLGPDIDGRVRRVPLVMSEGDQVRASLALAAVQTLVGSSPVLSSRGDETLRLGIDGHEIPLDLQGTLALRFRERDRPFSVIPARDVLDGRVAAGVLDERIVFVGPTIRAGRDTVSTPLGQTRSAVEVQATAAENLLQGTFMRPLAYRRAYEMLAALAFGLATAGLVGVLGIAWGLAAAVGLLLAFWIGCVLTVGLASAYLSPVMATLTVAAAATVAVLNRPAQRAAEDKDELRRRRQAHEFVVRSLTSLMEMRDPSTGRHSRRTQGYSRLLAQRLAHTSEYSDYLTDERIEFLSLLAPLHDIGKIGIRDALLNKTSALTPDEVIEMRQHPVYGYETISKTQRQVGMDSGHDDAVLQLAKEIVYTHHEWWDGSGYPLGLRGQEIPLAGRIVALVDVYDALVEPRPYRRRLPHTQAVGLIVKGKGTQFDPDVVDAFLTVEADFLELGTRLRERPAQPPPTH